MPDWLDDDLTDRRHLGLHRSRRRPQSAPGGHIRLGGRDVINFASNDYLALAADPRLARAAAGAAKRYGVGASASPLVIGHQPPLRRLERRLERWKRCAAALVFASGYAANLAVVGSLIGRADAVFSDELNHASLIDGCRLGRAAVQIYRHADVTHLGELLGKTAARRKFVVTDTVFSMDGDIAPLADVLDAARRYDAIVIADEAHATGVLGERGTGVAETVTRLLEGDDPERLIRVGTLSKALGSQGGFVVGTARLVDWLVNHARPYIFSTALASPTAAAAGRAVTIAEAEPDRRIRVLALADRLRSRLHALEFATARSACQIVPVLVGSPEDAVALSDRLAGHGVLAPAIRPPSVPPGTSRLRISLTAGHTHDNIERLVETLCRVRPGH